MESNRQQNYNKGVMTSSLGEEGKGIYGKMFKMFDKMIADMIPDMLRAIDIVPYMKNEGPYVICDYGASTGQTSQLLYKAAIEKIHTMYGSDTEILLMYEDQPVNDFKSLFLTTHGMNENQEWCLKNIPNVYVSAVGTSFYQQTVPSNSVHIAFSHLAAHWIGEAPVNLRDAIVHISDRVSEEERIAWTKHGLKCWHNFLSLRAKELKTGGRMIIKRAIDFDKEYMLPKNSGGVGTFDDLLRQMVDEDIIRKEEYIKINLPAYYGAVDELRSVLHNSESLFTKAGLSLVSVEKTICDLEIYSAWDNVDQDDEKQREEYFTRYEMFMKLTFNKMIYSGLSNQRTEEEKNVIVNEVFKRWTRFLKHDHDNNLRGVNADIYHGIFIIDKH